MKHTPGPWKAYTNYNKYFIKSEGETIAEWTINVNSLADATLISTAPELLEACEEAYRNLQDAGFLNEYPIMIKLVNIIAKAKGE